MTGVSPIGGATDQQGRTGVAVGYARMGHGGSGTFGTAGFITRSHPPTGAPIRPYGQLTLPFRMSAGRPIVLR